MLHPKLSDQLGAENLLGLVKITFLPKVTFLLSSYHSLTFHENNVGNQLPTRQAAGLICRDYLCSMFTCFDLNPGPATESCFIHPGQDYITCQLGEGHHHCPALLIAVMQLMYVLLTGRDPAAAQTQE